MMPIIKIHINKNALISLSTGRPLKTSRVNIMINRKSDIGNKIGNKILIVPQITRRGSTRSTNRPIIKIIN
jgi:hypothetical protein